MLFSWVAADSVYGVGDIEMALKRAAKGYVLGVSANHPFRSWGKPLAVAGTAKDIAEALPEDGWQRLSAGEGTKGPRLHDWTYLELADLHAGDFDAKFPGTWTRGLLIRRNIADGDLAFFSTWCPVGTSIETLVTVEGHRWAIEDSFETAKNEFGMVRQGRGRNVQFLLDTADSKSVIARADVDSNLVENAIRRPAMNRRNALFAGHDEGGRN